MTGEMCKEEVTRDAFPAHFAIADALGGTVEPFDQYQGPFVLVAGTRLWLTSEDGGSAKIFNESSGQSSVAFWLHYKDDKTLLAVAVEHAGQVYPAPEGKLMHLEKPRGGIQCGALTGFSTAEINNVNCRVCEAQHEALMEAQEEGAAPGPWSPALEPHSSGGDMMGLGDSDCYIVLHTRDNAANARKLAAAPTMEAALRDIVAQDQRDGRFAALALAALAAFDKESK